MNKQTKLILGVALVGVAGYMLWKQSSTTASLTGGVIGQRKIPFASASTVTNGRMSTPGKSKFTVGGKFGRSM